jgi:phosphatidylserine decarboxylase
MLARLLVALLARLFVALQYVLPRHGLTAIVYRIARIRISAIKNTLIRGFVRLYDVDIDDVRQNVPDDFPSFNEFFIRELAHGARPVAADATAIVSPVDGTVSAAASLEKHSILQAKGLSYSLDELFAVDIDEARAYANGCFTTIYLAPYNYHRVHMPIAGELVAAHYVPGDLFSVNEATVARVPGLFRRNERVNLHFKTAYGPAALIFVGALNVGSISTPWTGEIRPRKRGVVEALDISAAPRELQKGDLLGWFNMGSTVILLLPEGVAKWHGTLLPGSSVRMGAAIGSLSGNGQ